jgi:hypothetical protein
MSICIECPPIKEKQKRIGRNFQAVVHLLRCCAAARPPISIDTKRVANPAGRMISTWDQLELNQVPISEKSFKKVSNTFQIFPVSGATETLVDLLAHSRHGRSYAMILEVDHLVYDDQVWNTFQFCKQGDVNRLYEDWDMKYVSMKSCNVHDLRFCRLKLLEPDYKVWRHRLWFNLWQADVRLHYQLEQFQNETLWELPW